MYLGKIITYTDNTFRYAIKTIYYNNEKDHDREFLHYDANEIPFSSTVLIDEKEVKED